MNAQGNTAKQNNVNQGGVSAADEASRPKGDEGAVGAAGIRVIACLRDWNDVQQLTVSFPPDNPHSIEMLTWCQDGSRLFQDAITLEADAVILDPTVPGFSLDDIPRLYNYEERPIVVVAALPPVGDWHESMYGAGAKGHVQLPLSEEAVRRLPGIVHRAVQTALQERASPGYIPQVAPEVARAIATRGWQRASVAVWAAKGGVGKTAVAENIAVLLGVVGNRKTVLVDLNMAGGNVHIHLGVLPKKNVFSLASVYEFRKELRAREVQNHLSPYRGNLWVLPGVPRQYMAGESCFVANEGEQGKLFIAALMDCLREMFDFVILDLGQDLNHKMHLTALRGADLVLVVVNPETAGLLDTHEVLDSLFDHVQLDRSRFRLVINRFHPEAGISRKEIVQVLGLPEIGVIPEAGMAVTASLNAKRPLVLGKKCDVTDGLAQVTASIFPPLTDVWRAKGRLGAPRKGLVGRMMEALST